MRAELQRFAEDPAFFRQHLQIDTDDGLRRLGEVMDDWQRADFAAMDLGFRRACGHSVQGGHQRAWLERPRGHSKTSDLAIMATWALAFSGRAIKGICAAGDRDQARLIRDSIERLLRSNPWLGRALKIQQYRIVNKHSGSELEIISADTHTAYGFVLDFLLIDEISNWRPTAKPLWDALISTAAKRRHCMVVNICNAGFRESWNFEVREAVRADPKWYFRSLDGPVASWIDEDLLDEQRRLLPPEQFQRLWMNKWSSGSGDGLSPAWIQDSLTNANGRAWLPGPHPCALEHCVYSAGLDCGWKSDHSALIVAAGNLQTRKFELAECLSWDPRDYGGELPLSIVKDACREVHKRFHLECLMFDDTGFIEGGQQLAAAGLPMVRFMKENTGAQTGRCRLLLDCFRERRIRLYDGEPSAKGLLKDLHTMSIVERGPNRLYLEKPRDHSGHCDRGDAFSLALVALQLGGQAWAERMQISDQRDREESEQFAFS